MSATLDERARAAGDALLAAAELRPQAEAVPRDRATLRVAVTAAVVVVAVSIGAVIAFRGSAATPVDHSNVPPSSGKHATPQYKATTVLLAHVIQHNRTLSQDAMLLTIGVVPRRVTDALHLRVDPDQLVANVHAAPDEKTGTITITAVEPTSEQAQLIANTFGEQLIAYLGGVAKGDANLQIVAALQAQATLANELKPIVTQLNSLKAAGRDDAVLEAQLAALLSQFRAATADKEVLLRTVSTARYRLIEATHAVPVEG